jgi:hypothetical protein
MRTYLPILLLIPSIALLFLPYTQGVSPWGTVSDCDGSRFDLDLALLGGPFFLSIPIAIAQTRLLGRRRFPKAERAAYRILACAALGAVLALFVLALQRDGFSWSLITALLMWGILCAVAVWIMVRSHRMLTPTESAVVTMQAAWLPNALLCGFSYLSHWQTGAYLAALTIGLYTLEIAVSMRRRTRTSVGDRQSCSVQLSA